ncbi:MAG: glycoside hydrolase family 16 protein [Paludibacteraceae bacterium]|nr:glycoside hydrolase family 16 protein [Paludibacteraceae bacterium]
MKKCIAFVSFVICLILCWSENIFSRSSFEKSVSWEEEFDEDGMPNESIWNIENKLCKTELQDYQKAYKNSYCKDGVLHITCTKEESRGRNCVSARMNTQGKKGFLYGKIEVRAKVPVGKGIFPAIWMLPDVGTKPYGEIDLMEYIDCWNAESIQTNVHVVFEHGKRQYQYQKKVPLKVDVWHIYSLEWYKDRLVFLIDGKKVHELSKDQLEDWPFDRSHHLLLNVAFGGWGGSCGVDYDILPKEMLVDYVRYYKLKE